MIKYNGKKYELKPIEEVFDIAREQTSLGTAITVYEQLRKSIYKIVISPYICQVKRINEEIYLTLNCFDEISEWRKPTDADIDKLVVGKNKAKTTQTIIGRLQKFINYNDTETYFIGDMETIEIKDYEL